MVTIDWTKIYKKYKGLWVALKDDHMTVVASGKTAQDALSVSKKRGVENPFITKVPKQILPFIGVGKHT